MNSGPVEIPQTDALSSGDTFVLHALNEGIRDHGRINNNTTVNRNSCPQWHSHPIPVLFLLFLKGQSYRNHFILNPQSRSPLSPETCATLCFCVVLYAVRLMRPSQAHGESQVEWNQIKWGCVREESYSSEFLILVPVRDWTAMSKQRVRFLLWSLRTL